MANNEAPQGKDSAAPAGQNNSGLAITQEELDRLLSRGIQPAPAPESESKGARNAKVAARRARAADLAAQISAQQKHHITVIYGTASLSQEELDALKRGDSIRLDRKTDAAAEILVDGKPFAKGSLSSDGKNASVTLTRRLQAER